MQLCCGPPAGHLHSDHLPLISTPSGFLSAHVDHDLDPRDAAVSKLYATELHGRVNDRCSRVLGMEHFAQGDIVGQFYLDGRVSRIYGGSSEIMKVIIAQGFAFAS